METKTPPKNRRKERVVSKTPRRTTIRRANSVDIVGIFSNPSIERTFARTTAGYVIKRKRDSAEGSRTNEWLCFSLRAASASHRCPFRRQRRRASSMTRGHRKEQSRPYETGRPNIRDLDWPAGRRACVNEPTTASPIALCRSTN